MQVSDNTICSSDIPIHNYQLSWAPNPRFTSYYAQSSEIHEYIEKVADHHGLRGYIKTSHKVIHAKWADDKQKWEIKIVKTDGREVGLGNRNGHEDEVGEPWIVECDFFINGSGLANDWKWPSIPGRDRFRGKMIHTASWPKGVDFAGQTISLIGNGSSGVQVLGPLVEKADKVYVHVRNTTWLTVGFASKFGGPNGANINFSESQQDAWANDLEGYFEYRKLVEQELNSRFRTNLKGSKEQELARNFCLKQMSEQLVSRPDLLKRMIPEFSVG